VGDDVWADVGGVGVSAQDQLFLAISEHSLTECLCFQGDTGAMAEYAVVNCAQTGLKPKSLNFTEAGTIPLVGFTSLECLTKTGAPWSKPNLTVVVTVSPQYRDFVIEKDAACDVNV